MTRYIFVTGGVASSLGKGIATSALAAILQTRGYKVRIRKFDPYLNVDPGTMSPSQHGEVFVTDDGGETDLDLGHYERFTGVSSQKSDNVTSGQIYQAVIQKERRGDYLGATVQVIPHVTDMIKDYITRNTEDLDFMICEIGGTVGDIEGLPFIEAIRQLGNEFGKNQVLHIYLTLLPYIPSAGELKTKPTQHAVKELLNLGIQPDILLCRSDRPFDEGTRSKIALFCNVPIQNVIAALDVDTIYSVPTRYHQEGFDRQVLKHFALPNDEKPNMAQWDSIVAKIRNPKETIRIAIVGKYTSHLDSYKSLIEALTHGGIANETRVDLEWIESDRLERVSPRLLLAGADGILIPGGFGERGANGKMIAIQYARENKIPLFGICFGLQMAMVEAARNLLGLKNAGTTEFGPCEDPIVGLMTEWQKDGATEKRHAEGLMGGTMRLGAYPCQIQPGTLAHRVYGETLIHERHRHRYEVNIAYREALEKVGLIFSGMSPDGKLPEIMEYKDHPWFITVQFHPELKSRPFAPHPLFTSFVKAALIQKRNIVYTTHEGQKECQTA
ncbi:MAG: CTP synthase [Alphaproteobacteria bacterium]|nr:CTP synthase [Alphaproteobacteria bacterium]